MRAGVESALSANGVLGTVIWGAPSVSADHSVKIGMMYPLYSALRPAQRDVRAAKTKWFASCPAKTVKFRLMLPKSGEIPQTRGSSSKHERLDPL